MQQSTRWDFRLTHLALHALAPGTKQSNGIRDASNFHEVLADEALIDMTPSQQKESVTDLVVRRRWGG